MTRFEYVLINWNQKAVNIAFVYLQPFISNIFCWKCNVTVKYCNEPSLLCVIQLWNSWIRSEHLLNKIKSASAFFCTNCKPWCFLHFSYQIASLDYANFEWTGVSRAISTNANEVVCLLKGNTHRSKILNEVWNSYLIFAINVLIFKICVELKRHHNYNSRRKKRWVD